MKLLLAIGDAAVAEAMRPAFAADQISSVQLASLSEPAAFAALADVRPRAVVCVPRWDRADLDEVRGCWWLGRASALAEIPLVLVSTADIFDGADRRARTEFDRPDPIGPRGRAAAAVEQVLADSSRLGVVVRAGPLDVGSCAVARLLGDPAGVVGGGRTCVTPVAAADVGVLVREVAVGGRAGVFHAAGDAVSLAALAEGLGIAPPRVGSTVAPPPLAAVKPPMVGATPIAAWTGAG